MKLKLDHTELTEVEFTLKPGINLLLGKTGVGKSTLMKALFAKTDSSILMQDISQQFTMDTPYDELIFTLENLQKTDTSIIEKVANKCQITPYLHQKIHQLSGGQQSRVAFAVQLLLNKPLMILDEPFSSIDPAGRQEFINLLENLPNTILISDHDTSAYSAGTRVLQFTKKALIETTLVDTSSENLSKKFVLPQNPILELNGIPIERGKITLLTGPNGAGKTTFFKEIIKLKPARVKFFGNPTAALAFQEASMQFLAVTLADELKITPDRLNLVEKFNLEPLLNRSLYKLSKGQQRLIQLILMINCDHDILLLDEPLAGLDSEVIAKLLPIIASLEKTIVICSHQIEVLLPYCQLHLTIDHNQFAYKETL
ncbi:MAG: ATP-binding cassette domain-containing protein [Lactobacillus sp.]|nr:ATP-binding cassette domain-containing protein [Lactobacillus sp.]